MPANLKAVRAALGGATKAPPVAAPKNKGGRPPGRKDSAPRRSKKDKRREVVAPKTPAPVAPIDPASSPAPAHNAPAPAPAREENPAPSSASRLTREEFSGAFHDAAPLGASAGPDPAVVAQHAATVAQVAAPLFDWLASAFGEHWRLLDGQAELLGSLIAPVSARHVSAEASGWAPYVACVVGVGAIVAPRVAATQRGAKLDRAESTEAVPVDVPRASTTPGATGPSMFG